MLNFLNQFGLPVKYAVIGAVSVVTGVFLAGLLGMNVAMSYLAAAISGAVGGAVGGYIRKRQGKRS